MSPQSIISVENLRKRYGDAEVVKGVSFQIHRGEFFGLLGPNGAGKTTTIAMLSGLTEPTGGRILIDGLDPASEAMEAKAKLGLVPQNFALYPTLCARDNLDFFGKLYGLKGTRLRERTAAVLEIVQLTDRAHQPVATYSHGMKRRLNIAAGLLHEPELLILDEPTLGVDAQSRNAILESLESLNRSGMTLLYTTHSMEEAQRFCRRVAIMDDGNVIALDAPSSLIKDHGKGMVRIELNRRAEEALLSVMERLGSLKVMDGQTRVHLETEDTDRALRDLLDLFGKREGLLKELDVTQPNLETVFIHLTGRDLHD